MHLDELIGAATPIDGGYCVKIRSDGRYCIDVMKMAFNWRILFTVRPPDAEEHRIADHGWCYRMCARSRGSTARAPSFTAEVKAHAGGLSGAERVLDRAVLLLDVLPQHRQRRAAD